MDHEHLRKKLVAAARRNPPSDDVPYAFEKRVMARLSSGGVEDSLSLWGCALWKGAAACAALTAISIVLSVWSFGPAHDASAEFEAVVLAGADQMTEAW